MKNYLTFLLVGYVVFNVSCKKEELPQVIADFSIDEKIIIEGDQVSFSESSSGAPTEWHWTFEGGVPNESSERNPVVTYNDAGEFEVTLLAKNSQHSGTATKTIHVSPVLVPKFSSDATIISEGDSITFSDESIGEPVEWHWAFEGGQPAVSLERNPTVYYANSGIFSVTLVVVSSDQTNSVTNTGYVEVYGPVNANISLAGSQYNLGDNVVLEENSSGLVTEWTWNIEGITNGPVNSKNPSITLGSAGLHKVELIVSNPLFSSKDSTEIAVFNEPGLVLKLLFDNGIDDSSGFSHLTTNTGVIQTTGHNGNANSAYYFDGINDYIEIENSPLFESQTYSISAWIKAEDVTGAILSMSRFSPFILNNSGYYFSILDLQLRSFYNIGSPNWAMSVSNPLINIGNWHHVATTYNGANIILYIDGIEVLSTASSAPINYVEHNPILIGTYVRSNGAGTWFTGAIDDILVFNQALSAQEIEVLANQ